MFSNKQKYFVSDIEFIKNKAASRKGSPQSDWVSGSIWGSPVAILLQDVGAQQWMKR